MKLSFTACIWFYVTGLVNVRQSNVFPPFYVDQKQMGVSQWSELIILCIFGMLSFLEAYCMYLFAFFYSKGCTCSTNDANDMAFCGKTGTPTKNQDICTV